MRIAVGSDCTSHLTAEIAAHLESKGHELERCGAMAGRASDYVDAGAEVATAVSSGRCAQGLIFCNTGTGVTIIANKFYGVRAALCVDAFSARIARLANNANVLVLGMRLTGEPHAREIVDSWLETEPSTEPRRVNFHRKTDELDRKLRWSGSVTVEAGANERN
jgi:ribose 5-phosphate isomerase B